MYRIQLSSPFFQEKALRFQGIYIYAVSILYAFFMIRLFFPFDFDLGIPVPVPFVINIPYRWIKLNQHTLFGVTFPLIVPLTIFSLTVGAVKCFFLWKKYRRLNQIVRLSSSASQEEEQALLRLQKKLRVRGKIRLHKSSIFPVPFSLGIFRKRICLPEAECREEELEYILLHELNHFKRQDHLLILMARVTVCVFWWFPCSYMILKDLESFLEVRCDLFSTRGMDASQRAGYLEAIMQTMKRGETARKTEKALALSLTGSGNQALLEERFETVAKNRRNRSLDKPGKWKSAAAALFLFGTLVFSYSFIFFPAYSEQASEEIKASGAIEVTPEEGYILCTKDGKVYLVWEDQKFPMDPSLLEPKEEVGLDIVYEE